MVSSQPYRSGTAQAWWAHTGSTNRGFVSLDPERQREVDCDRPAPKKQRGNQFAFDVCQAGAKGGPRDRGRRAPAAPGPLPAEDGNRGEPAAPEGGEGKRGRRR